MKPDDRRLPGPEVTKVLFEEWRSPRRGTSNPQNMNNPVWEWLVRTKCRAYTANNHFDGPSPFDAGPAWCCERFGQSSTQLPDGRTILVAGEHEDWYDPNFYIYNDVIVLQPDDRIDIFGYPETDFPPTDFHSATLVDNQLILIGNLGYSRDRRPSETPVFALDIQTLRIARIATTGSNPGWIHDHSATLDCGEIYIHGGELFDGNWTENIDDWKLNPRTWSWTRLTDRRWVRVEVSRKDDDRSILSRIRFLRISADSMDLYEAFPETAEDLKRDYKESVQNDLNEVTKARGGPADFAALDSLYQPPIEHETLPEKEDEHNIFRIRVAGIIVRYVEKHRSITMTIEGELPQQTVELLADDLLQKFREIENADCVRKVY